jgi:hypothetical protein
MEECGMCRKRTISWPIWGLAAGALLVASAAAAQVAPGADAAGAVEKPAAAKPAAKPTPAATPAAAKAKAKKPAAPAKVEVVVTNKRAVALTALLASTSGSPDSDKIAGPLAAGKKTVIHISPGKDCLFDLRGLYADGTSTVADGVDLCKDKTINLVD